jgi:hypothetical protein
MARSKPPTAATEHPPCGHCGAGLEAHVRVGTAVGTLRLCPSALYTDVQPDYRPRLTLTQPEETRGRKKIHDG